MLSKLEAVNQLLDSIGEAPISTLEDTDLEVVETAIKLLDRVSREVQTKGWHCNTSDNFKLQRDVRNYIPLPYKSLRIDAVGLTAHLDVTSRDNDGFICLYNKADGTFEFGSDVFVDVVWLLDWEYLTPDLQLYVAAKAAREFQMSSMGSDKPDRYLEKKEMEAYASLMDAEAELDDYNVLTNSYHSWYITHRNNTLFRR